MGLFDKFFNKKRSNSQPPNNNDVQKKPQQPNNNPKNFINSVPNLSSTQQSNRENLFMVKKGNNYNNTQSYGENVKSLGELNPNTVDTDDDDLSGLNTTSRILKTNELTNVSSTLFESKKSSAGYESSSSSSESNEQTNDLEFLNTLDNTTSRSGQNLTNSFKNRMTANINEDNDTKSSISLSTTKMSLADQIKQKQKLKQQLNNEKEKNPLTKSQTSNKSGLTPSVTFREPEANLITNVRNYDSSDTTQNPTYESTSQKDLIEENRALMIKIEKLEKQALERESKHKTEMDKVMIKVHESLTKEMQSPSEKNALTKVLLSKQQETSEKLINEQSRTIDVLKAKCQGLENELFQIKNSNVHNEKSRDEINNLKILVQRLNNELSSYQNRYPNHKPELRPLYKEEAWNIDTKQLKPLLEAYDEKLNERDEKIKLMKKKLDDVTSKFKLIIDENNELHLKLEELPQDVAKRVNDIRKQAEIVLEENKLFSEQLEIEKNKSYDMEKHHIQELSRLSKKVVVCETEKVNLMNQIDILRLNNDELVKKYNDLSLEVHRKVNLQDHLNQIGDLKRKMEENAFKSKQELEECILKLQAIEHDKKDLSIKLTDLLGENSKLKGQIRVLEKALDDEKKIHPNKQELVKKIESSLYNEKKAYSILEKFKNQLESLKKDKEKAENILKLTEEELKETQIRLSEESLKLAKMESKFEEYKEKTATKLSKTLEKFEEKSREIELVKINSDKKVAELLRHLQKKQDQIEDFLKEKKEIENDIEKTWEKTSSENNKLKQVLFEIKTKPNYL